MKIFIGGPIQYATNEEGYIIQSYREIILRIIETLEGQGYEVLSAYVEEQFGAVSYKYSHEEICYRDYMWMKECDKYIAIIPNGENGKLLRSDGTSVELGWASALEKDITIICDNNRLHTLSQVIKGLGSLCTVEYMNMKKVLEHPECLISELERTILE